VLSKLALALSIAASCAVVATSATFAPAPAASVPSVRTELAGEAGGLIVAGWMAAVAVGGRRVARYRAEQVRGVKPIVVKARRATAPAPTLERLHRLLVRPRHARVISA
jgi:hypothetical protein